MESSVINATNFLYFNLTIVRVAEFKNTTNVTLTIEVLWDSYPIKVRIWFMNSRHQKTFIRKRNARLLDDRMSRGQ